MSSAKVRCRNWTPEETELFANVLADEDNRFTASLERLALKKAANNEVFDHIKNIFDREQGKKDFKDKNEERNFCNKNGDLQSYSPLDTSVNKLRSKYTSLKAEWQKISDRAKCGSRLALEKEPKWYKILNPVFTETNEDLEIKRNSADVFFSLNEGDDEIEISEKDSSQGSNFSGVNNKDVPGDEETPCSSKAKTKLVVAPRKKRKVVRSQNQALSHMAKGMEDLASSQIKCAKLMIEADQKRDELFLKHKEEEAKRNREHELRLAQIYATALAYSTQNRTNNNWQMHHTTPANQEFRPHFMSTPAQSTSSQPYTSCSRNETQFYNHSIRE